MGVGLEFLQGAVGYRSYEIADMYANTLGVALGWALGAVLRPRLPRPADQSRL
jgi:glycopeptide antibiotics resistance protein